MSALDVLRQIKQAKRSAGATQVVEWGNADYINKVGIDNLSRRELRNHLEARDLVTSGTRLELIERLRASLVDEQLHKFAYVETVDTEFLIQAELEERGSVYVVGNNACGQLGVGDFEPRTNFTCIPALKGIGVIYVYAGVDMCYAVTNEHDVYCWGGNGVGATGIQPPKKKTGEVKAVNNWLEPQLVKELAGEEVVAVVVGASHCLAMGKAGDCFVWGNGDCGQLGLGDFSNHPQICINNSFPAVSAVSTGKNHSAVIATEQIYIWGHAHNGRLGIGHSERMGVPERERYFFPLPTKITTLEPIKEISCGADHTLARGRSGVWAWGSGSGGKLGLSDNNDRYEPCLVHKLRGKFVITIAAGTWHSMAIVNFPPMMGGGFLYTWGSGYYGQLAQGTKLISQTPEIVEYFVKRHLLVKQIAAGSHHCVAITSEGEMYSWGSNKSGCLARKLPDALAAFTATPGHCGGFGAIVHRVGRGLVRTVSCGQEYTICCTYPYTGPDYQVAGKLMQEAKVREQEALLKKRSEQQALANQQLHF